VDNAMFDFRSVYANMRWTFMQNLHACRRASILIIVMSVIQGLIPALFALTTRGLINSVTEVVSVASADQSPIRLWLLLGCLVAMVGALADIVFTYCQQRLNDEMSLHITTDFMLHAAKLDYAFFESPDSLDMMQKARNNMAQHFTQFFLVTLKILSALIQIGTLLALLLSIQPVVVLLVAPIAIVYLVFEWRFARTRYAEENTRATKNRWMSYFVGQLTNENSVAQVKILGLSDLFIEKFRRIMTEFRDRNRLLYRHANAGGALFAVVSIVAVFIALGFVTSGVIADRLTIGDVAIYGAAVLRLRGAIESVIGWVGSLRWQTLYVSNLQAFFRVESTMKVDGSARLERCEGDIRIENLDFRYPGSETTILRNINLHIRPGETIAIVGENGAGKTTLAKLLARLYDPSSGVIYVDGRDIREIAIDSYHRQIAFVFQNFEKYAANAQENIAYGDWQRLLGDREAVERIARRAGVEDLILKMPAGYDTMLGRKFGTYTPSGGQWQRLAIARAFARDAAILLLDEPTSSIDAKAEFALFSDFKELVKGRTSILISHRFSTVTMADRIVVMDQGTIVEQGSHRELIEKNGQYASLYALHRRQVADGKDA
jgi:ATP-binding cassette subfamily B protein